MLRFSEAQFSAFQTAEMHVFVARLVRDLKSLHPAPKNDIGIDAAIQQLEVARSFGLRTFRHATSFLVASAYLGPAFADEIAVRNVMNDARLTAQAKCEFLLCLVDEAVSVEGDQ